jgi:predicted DNA-binding transcriptional regulator AlpA
LQSCVGGTNGWQSSRSELSPRYIFFDVDPVIVPNLDEILHDPGRARSLPLSAIAALLIRCGTVQSALALALAVRAESQVGMREFDNIQERKSDRPLTIDEAMSRTGLSRDALYRRRDLPFRLRLGPGTIRFSERGIEHWLQAKKINPSA